MRCNDDEGASRTISHEEIRQTGEAGREWEKEEPLARGNPHSHPRHTHTQGNWATSCTGKPNSHTCRLIQPPAALVALPRADNLSASAGAITASSGMPSSGGPGRYSTSSDSAAGFPAEWI